MSDWPHAPLHRFEGGTLFFVTAGTYLKRHVLRSRPSLDAFRDRLFSLSRDHDCSLQAWAIFSNHYHLVVQGDGNRLHALLSQLHSLEAIECNRRDNSAGRQVFFQFRDTQLTYEKSWLARLRYTHENAVHHRLVSYAENYPWCSAAWFGRVAPRSFFRTVRSFKIDRVSIRDDFDVEGPE